MSTIAEIYASMEYGPAPESPKPALDWIARREGRMTAYVDGAWVGPSNPTDPDAWFSTVNPATGEPLAQVAQVGGETIDAAVAAARTAQPGWWALGGHGRAKLLYAWSRAAQRHARLLAVLETLDNGKPIRESRDIDVPLVARHLLHHAGWAQLQDQRLPKHVPMGVVGQVIPWNFPLLMFVWKVAPALAAGNTVVIKPAESTTLSALLMAELAHQIGLPKGVLNVVTGDGRVGSALVEHRGIDKVAFTGSTAVGRAIRVATAGHGKALTLELGGKSPFIVFDDADLDSVVEGIVDAIWFNQGEVCCAGSRLLVQESVAEPLLHKLRVRMETLRVGNPLDKTVDIGAIISPAQRERIEALIKVGIDEGATCWQPATPVPEQGCFVPPTVLSRVQPSSTVAQQEIFGPVLVSMTFRSTDEAIALANNSRYGLAASVWTDRGALALDVARSLEAGVVWINSTNTFDAACGFGGVRESGFGREGGLEGLLAYLRPAREVDLPAGEPTPSLEPTEPSTRPANRTGIDRTFKLYIGGKQVRPDGGQSQLVLGPTGQLIADVALGNRKDIRNAVEAAHKAGGWGSKTGHARAQVLYFVAENLEPRRSTFVSALTHTTDVTQAVAEQEFEATLRRLFSYAAWADKLDGAVHHPAQPNTFVLAVRESIGVLGLVAPEAHPLLSLISLLAPAVAMGNRVVVVPSSRHPLPAVELISVLESSDVPAGVVNLVTGERDALAQVLAAHDDVDAVWYHGSAEGSAAVERLSAGNMKRTWVSDGRTRDWLDPSLGEGTAFLDHATRIKNVWVPFGD